MPTRLALCLLLISSVAAGAKRDAAEEAYQEARTAYYALKERRGAGASCATTGSTCATRFEAVATDYPKSERAPDALYTAGELISELSRISFVSEDLQAAVADYSKLVETFPRHRLADDAALSLARIHLERLDQPEAARRVLTDTLAANRKGDRARELKALLSSLPPRQDAARGSVPVPRWSTPSPSSPGMRLPPRWCSAPRQADEPEPPATACSSRQEPPAVTSMPPKPARAAPASARPAKVGGTRDCLGAVEGVRGAAAAAYRSAPWTSTSPRPASRPSQGSRAARS